MIRHATKFAPRSAAEFQVAYDAGYRNAELWLDVELIANWGELVTLASDFPIGYALHFPNRGKITDRHLRDVIDLYHALNCSALVIHQPMFDQYGKKLLSLDRDLKLGVENHDLGSDTELETWANESAWLTLDVEHLWIYTAKDRPLKKMLRRLASLLDEHAHKLVHVHLPGYLPGCKVHRPQYCSRKMVMEVFTMLADIDFDGLVVSETAKKYHTAEDLQMDLLLQRLWQRQYESSTSRELVGLI